MSQILPRIEQAVASSFMSPRRPHSVAVPPKQFSTWTSSLYPSHLPLSEVRRCLVKALSVS